MAESDTHLPKKVFKAEKRSYIDDEKKHKEEKRERREILFRYECACYYESCANAYARDRMYAYLRVCERKIGERER